MTSLDGAGVLVSRFDRGRACRGHWAECVRSILYYYVLSICCHMISLDRVLRGRLFEII